MGIVVSHVGECSLIRDFWRFREFDHGSGRCVCHDIVGALSSNCGVSLVGAVCSSVLHTEGRGRPRHLRLGNRGPDRLLLQALLVTDEWPGGRSTASSVRHGDIGAKRRADLPEEKTHRPPSRPCAGMLPSTAWPCQRAFYMSVAGQEALTALGKHTGSSHLKVAVATLRKWMEDAATLGTIRFSPALSTFTQGTAGEEGHSQLR